MRSTRPSWPPATQSSPAWADVDLTSKPVLERAAEAETLRLLLTLYGGEYGDPYSPAGVRPVIVDAAGKRVKLCGANWAGAHQDPMVPGGLDYRPRGQIAAQLAGWGFNSVRLTFALSTVTATAPVLPALISANPDLRGRTPWQVYQACVTALTGAGLMVIPNATCCTGGGAARSPTGTGCGGTATGRPRPSRTAG